MWDCFLFVVLCFIFLYLVLSSQKRIPQRTDQEIAAELLTITRTLGEIEARHTSASSEVRTTEDELRKLGDRLVQRVSVTCGVCCVLV